MPLQIVGEVVGEHPGEDLCVCVGSNPGCHIGALTRMSITVEGGSKGSDNSGCDMEL